MAEVVSECLFRNHRWWNKSDTAQYHRRESIRFAEVASTKKFGGGDVNN